MATRAEQLEELGIEKYVPESDLGEAFRILRAKLKTRERRFKGLIGGYPKRTKKRKSASGTGGTAVAESGGHESGET